MAITYGSIYYQNGAGNAAYYNSVCKLTATKIAVAFRDEANLGKGKVVIGTIANDDEITWGSEYTFESGTVSTGTTGPAMTITRLSDTKFVIGYGDYNNPYTIPTLISGTVSGTVVTFGSSVAAYSGTGEYDSAAVCVEYLDTDKVAFVYHKSSTGNLYSRIATLSGTTITLQTEYTASTDRIHHTSISAIDSTHFVVAGVNLDDSTKGVAAIGVVSGNVVTFGSLYAFESGTMTAGAIANMVVDVAGIDSTHFVVAYKTTTASTYGACKVATISSGNVISYGSEYSLETTGNAAWNLGIEKWTSSKFVVIYRWYDATPAYQFVSRVGTISGTTISYDDRDTIQTAEVDVASHGIALLDSSHIAITWRDATNSNQGETVIGVLPTAGGEYIASGSVTIGGAADTEPEYSYTASGSVATGGEADYLVNVYSYESSGSVTISGDADVEVVYGEYIAVGSITVSGVADTLLVDDVFISEGIEPLSGKRIGYISKLDTNKFINVYSEDSTKKIFCRVGTVGATIPHVIAFGSGYEAFQDPSGIILAYDVTVLNSTKFVLAFSKGGTDRKVYAVVGTVSGNSISYGTIYQITANQYDVSNISALDQTHCILFYDSISDNAVYAIILTISGTTISYGASHYTITSNGLGSEYKTAVTVLDSTHFIAIVEYPWPGTNHVRAGLIHTGDQITLGSLVDIPNDNSSSGSITKVDSTHAIVTFQGISPGPRGTAQVVITLSSDTVLSVGIPVSASITYSYFGVSTDSSLFNDNHILFNVDRVGTIGSDYVAKMRRYKYTDGTFLFYNEPLNISVTQTASPGHIRYIDIITVSDVAGVLVYNAYTDDNSLFRSFGITSTEYWTGVGEIEIVGSADSEVAYSYAGIGGAATNGAADYTEWTNHYIAGNPTGGTIVGGAADTEEERLYFYTSSGSVIVDGIAGIIHTVCYTASGSIIISGAAYTASYVTLWEYIPTGGITVSGTAPHIGENWLALYEGSGSVIIGGSAESQLTGEWVYVASGSVSVAGSATYVEWSNYYLNYDGSGGLITAGTADYIEWTNHYPNYTGSGTLFTVGGEAYTIVIERDMSGIIVIGGACYSFVEISYISGTFEALEQISNITLVIDKTSRITDVLDGSSKITNELDIDSNIVGL